MYLNIPLHILLNNIINGFIDILLLQLQLTVIWFNFFSLTLLEYIVQLHVTIFLVHSMIPYLDKKKKLSDII